MRNVGCYINLPNFECLKQIRVDERTKTHRVQRVNSDDFTVSLDLLPDKLHDEREFITSTDQCISKDNFKFYNTIKFIIVLVYDVFR